MTSNAETLKRKHPKGLYLLFFTEMWERFSYYGMRALLILYLTKTAIEGGLGFSAQNASLIYGLFTGFVYFTPLIGGWLADRYLGQRKSITIGALTMMAGQFFLAAEASSLFLSIGLILLVIGNGFFKPNISVLVGQLYEPQDNRRDSAFTIFYMGINLGAFLAPLLTGYLAVTYGYRWGFVAAGLGMLIGQILFSLLSKKLLGNIGNTPVKQKQEERNQQTVPLTKVEKDRTWVIMILMLFTIIFWSGFEQAGSSMTLFANQDINRQLFSFTIPTEWFQSINPVFIVTLSPLFSMLWEYLGRKKKEPAVPMKMGIGLIFLSVGFLILVLGCLNVTPTVKANMLWLIGAYLFHTFGELCLSPIGLSMVTKLAPIKLASLMMGVWFLSSFIANLLGGFLSSVASQLGLISIFGAIAGAAFLFGLILILLNKKLLVMMHGIR